MAPLKKYNKPQIEVVSLGKDIIVTSIDDGNGGTDPFKGKGSYSAINKMDPLERPLGIFKRD